MSMTKMPEKFILVAQSRVAAEAAIRDLGGNTFQLIKSGRASIRVWVPGETADDIRGLELPWAVLPGTEITPTQRQFLMASTRQRERDFHELLCAHLCWRIWHDC